MRGFLLQRLKGSNVRFTLHRGLSMHRNPLGYLGMLGFVGLLGLVTGDYRLFLFFPFGVFSLFLIRGTDERLDRNLKAACRNAFMYTLVDLTFTLAYLPFIQPTRRSLGLVVGIAFIGTVFVFVFSWVYHQLVRPAE